MGILENNGRRWDASEHGIIITNKLKIGCRPRMSSLNLRCPASKIMLAVDGWVIIRMTERPRLEVLDEPNLSYSAMSCYVMLRHAMSCYVMLCQ